MSKAYILTGQTGEYSDYRSWTVAVYSNRDAADAEAKRLNDWCKAHGLHDGSADYAVRYKIKPDGDPNFECDYTGTGYTVEEAELRDATTLKEQFP